MTLILHENPLLVRPGLPRRDDLSGKNGQLQHEGGGGLDGLGWAGVGGWLIGLSCVGLFGRGGAVILHSLKKAWLGRCCSFTCPQKSLEEGSRATCLFKSSCVVLVWGLIRKLVSDYY